MLVSAPVATRGGGRMPWRPAVTAPGSICAKGTALNLMRDARSKLDHGYALPDGFFCHQTVVPNAICSNLLNTIRLLLFKFATRSLALCNTPVRLMIVTNAERGIRGEHAGLGVLSP